MNKKMLAGLLTAGVLVASGTTIGYAGVSKVISEPQVSAPKQEKMKVALENRLQQVYTELKTDGLVPSNFLQYDYFTINDVDKNLAWSAQTRELLRNSSLQNINEHGVDQTYVPVIYVKPDASEYVIGYKKVTGENEIVHYKLLNGVYTEVHNIKRDGVAFSKTLDETTR